MVTIADVARHAGVSPSTVSYVLSRKRSISDQTRTRVENSVRTLGYHAHAGAKALASKRSNVLALVVPLRSGSHVPVQMQFATSVVTTARVHDHDVLLLTQDEGDKGLQRAAGSALVDAFIVMDVELHDARVPLLRSLASPSVLIGYPADSEGLTCIDLDFVAAGELCVDHLADLGHQQVSLVGSPQAVYARETGFAPRTLAGFQAAVQRRGLTATTHSCEPSTADVRGVVRDMLEQQPDLSGVVVHNESVLELLLEALHEAGGQVPEDLSVVAICPDELASSVQPELSSVAIPAKEVGSRAVELLMGKLDGEDVPAASLLEPKLTVRSSTAKRR